MLRCLLTLVLLSSLVSCGGTKKKSSSSSSSSTMPIEQAPPDTSYFYINHSYIPGYTRYTRFLNNDGTVNYNKKCGVDLNSTVAADKDINCVVDSFEYDIFFGGMKFDFNVPKTNKCVYLERYPFFYWRYATEETGSTAITLTRTAGQVVSQMTSNPAVTYDVANSQVKCDYDYTAQEGPNCCEGSYTITSTDDDDNDAVTAPIVTTTEGELSGNMALCLDGPALEYKDSKGYPMVLVTRLATSEDTTDTGANNTGTYDVPSPMSLKYRRNINVANAVDVVPGTFPAVPYEIDVAPSNQAFMGLGTAPVANAAYEWACSDDAGEIQGRIRVFVREWNTRAAMIADHSGTNSNPNLSGNETDFPDQPNDDRWDWFRFFTETTPNSHPGKTL